MKPVSLGDILTQVRLSFEGQLRGPGVTWNKAGVLNAYDKAVAFAMVGLVDENMRDEVRIVKEITDGQARP